MGKFLSQSLATILTFVVFAGDRVAAQSETGASASVVYRLPYDGTARTYRVTIAAAPADQPNWLVSTFVAGAVRKVDASNKGVFTEVWDGLDDNFIPVPPGRYVFRGIYAAAEKWAIDGQYHSLVPQYVVSPGDSWAPIPTQDYRFPPAHGHVFEPIYDVSVGPENKAVFLSGYIENWLNPFLVDLSKPVGIDQIIRMWNSSGRSGGQHVAYDGRDVWMVRFNEVYCHTNPKFGDVRTRRGKMVAVLGKDKKHPTDMTAVQGNGKSLLYICEPHHKRITVLDGRTGTVYRRIAGVEAKATAVSEADGKRQLFVLHRVGDEFEISRAPLNEAGLAAGDLQSVTTLPPGPTPQDLAISRNGQLFTIRGRQVFGYDRSGKPLLVLGKNERLNGTYDPNVLVHPRTLAVWTDGGDRSRLIVTETGGPMRTGEWSCEDGSLLRQWNLCQNAAGGFCVDPDNPSHIYATSLNTPELLRYTVDYRTGKWEVDAVWEGLCHRSQEDQFPGGRMFPQIIKHKGRKYLCFAGGAFRAYGNWMVYRQVGDRWLPAAACVKNRWWHDANGDGQWQDKEVSAVPDRGVGTYWAGKFLDDLSIVEVPKRGHAVRRLKPTRFDRHGNPIYHGDAWQTMATDSFASAIARGNASTLHPLYGGNEVGNQFWDWSDAARGDDDSLYVAGVYKPDGITGYKFDEAGQVCAQWKLTKWSPGKDGSREMAWRVGRKAFGPAKPGEVYAPMHVSKPVHGLLGMHDGNGLYHVFSTGGLYVDTLMYDRFRFGNITRGGMYCHSGGSYFGRNFLNQQDGHVYILMGRASNNIYRVPQWKPGVIKPLPINTESFDLKPEQIAAAPRHVIDLRKRYKLLTPRIAAQLDSTEERELLKPKLTVKDVTRPFDKKQMIRLTDRKPVAAKASFYPVGINRYTGDQPQQTPIVDGKPCGSFVFAHAPSVIAYAIPAGFNTFTAVGTTLNNRDFAFVVRADGQVIYRTKELSELGSVVPIRVTLPAGTKRIELIVDALKSPRADHAVWAFPRLSK